MADEKVKTPEEETEKERQKRIDEEREEMDDYLEEQGIFIRQ